MHRAVIILLFGLAWIPLAKGTEVLSAQREAAFKDGDHYAEIEIIRRMLDEDPSDAELKTSLIRLWVDINDLTMAEQALTAWPEAPAGLRATTSAKVQVQKGDLAGAEATLTHYLQTTPGDREATQLLASFYAQDPTKLRDFLNASPLTEKDQGLMLRRAAAQRSLGNYEAALADYALAKKLEPESALIRDVSPAYERLAQALPALQASQAILSKEPEDFSALLQWAYYAFYADLPRQQVQSYAEKALQRDASAMAPRLLLAKTVPLSSGQILSTYGVDSSQPLPEAGAFDQLVKLDIDVAKDPTAASPRLKRAFLLGEPPPQYRLALSEALAVLKTQENNKEAAVEVVYAASRLNDLSTAREWMAKLAALRPPAKILAQARLYLSEAELANGNPELALDQINEALSAENKPAYLKQRAAIYARLNRQTEADADLAKAVSLEKRR
jgi:tetratricopeptide (TPR) repeat protein